MRDILVIKLKKVLKTDKCLEVARKVEEHFNGDFKVLILDKNVETIEWFDMPKEEVVVNDLKAIDEALLNVEETKGE